MMTDVNGVILCCNPQPCNHRLSFSIPFTLNANELIIKRLDNDKKIFYRLDKTNDKI